MKFYDYQKKALLDQSRLRIFLKSRQIGFSFVFCYEAVKKAIQFRRNVLLASASLRQSNELNYKCRRWIEVYKAFLPIKLDADSRSEIGISGRGRILTLPSNPKTIRGFNGDVYLDEFALHKDQKEIYRALFPSITRGYNLTIVSTPLGKSDTFYEIWSDSTKFRDFSRHSVNIYQAREQGFNIDIDFITNNTDEETFQQEYLCQFVDESASFFPYDLIKSCTGDDYAEGENYIGIDVGRKRDLTVVFILSKSGDHYYQKNLTVIKGKRFGDQKSIISELIRSHSITRGAIDSTGIGLQLAEDLHDEFYFIEPVHFNNQIKEYLVTLTKKVLETGQITIQSDRDLINDIHNIKKTVTKAGNIIFDSERTDQGHSDRFWALALAIYASQNLKNTVIDQVGIY